MFLYESKKPAASIKAASSNKSPDSGRRVHINSETCRNNRQALNLIIQKMPIPTAVAPKSGYAAGSPRLPYIVSPDPLNDVSFNEYGSSGNFSDGDVKYIFGELSSNNWRERIDDYEKDPIVKRIFRNWMEFLELFLKNCNFTSYGAEPSHTYHRSGKNDTAGSHEHRDSKQIPKIDRMYEGSLGKRGRRKYKTDEEIKRYLRHCAAALKLSYKLGSEIQCYYDNEDNVVYIAANDPNDENKLSEIDGDQISKCLAFLQHSLKEINESIADDDSFPIWSGSKAKLFDAFLSNKKDKPLLRRLMHALMCPSALSGAKIHAIKSREVNVKIHGLHAERKILYYLRSQKNDEGFFLDPLRLGGIRRPCFICAALCFENMSQVRPGPCWVSEAGSKPKDTKEMFLILDAIRNNDNITYITDTNGHLTMDHDTESSEGSECD